MTANATTRTTVLERGLAPSKISRVIQRTHRNRSPTAIPSFINSVRSSDRRLYRSASRRRISPTNSGKSPIVRFDENLLVSTARSASYRDRLTITSTPRFRSKLLQDLRQSGSAPLFYRGNYSKSARFFGFHPGNRPCVSHSHYCKLLCEGPSIFLCGSGRTKDRQRREPAMHDMIASALCRRTVS
jgi:hypothetical protein